MLSCDLIHAGQVSLSMVVPRTATATTPLLSMCREAKALGLRVTTPVPQKLHATAEGRAMAEQLLSAMLLVQLQWSGFCPGSFPGFLILERQTISENLD